MAYLKELRRVPCQEASLPCRKEAVVEAYDNHNKPAGLFCRKHGKKRLEVLLKEVL